MASKQPVGKGLMLDWLPLKELLGIPDAKVTDGALRAVFTSIVGVISL